MEGLGPGDNENDVNPSTRNLFQTPFSPVSHSSLILYCCMEGGLYRSASSHFRKCGLRWLRFDNKAFHLGCTADSTHSDSFARILG